MGVNSENSNGESSNIESRTSHSKAMSTKKAKENHIITLNIPRRYRDLFFPKLSMLSGKHGETANLVPLALKQDENCECKMGFVGSFLIFHFNHRKVSSHVNNSYIFWDKFTHSFDIRH